MRLEGKVALITGAARGQGAAEARLFAKEGAKVVIADVLDQEGTRVAAEIAETGADAVFVHLDVTSEEAWADAVNETVSAFGKLDILVNNAGIWEGTYFIRLKKETWDRVVNMNMTAAYLMAKAVSRGMLKRRCGKIINIASILGFKGSPQAMAYCATKGALLQMTKVMALELGPAHVQVNAIAPGFFETDMTRSYQQDEKSREILQKYVSRIPSGRYGYPQDLAGTVVFLASKGSDRITGQTLVVDGGESRV